MKIPKVDLATWKDLYAVASEFRALEPWNHFDDDELFGVQDPATGEIGYCCVLGAIGRVFALCVYRGSEGLALHTKMQDGEIDPDMDDAFAIQNNLMVTFTDRGDLEPEDLKVIKSIGFKPKKSLESPPYPQFQDYRPGYSPWFVTEDDAKWLAFALRCAIDAVQITLDDNGIMASGDAGEYFVYSQNKNADPSKPWTTKFVKPAPLPSRTFSNYR